jgi:hypothetical protein
VGIAALVLLPAGALADGGAGGPADTTGASAAFPADGFLSPDGKTWCSGNAQEVGCVSFRAGASQGPGHGAVLKRGGQLILCREQSDNSGWNCFQNFDETAPVLHYGRRAEIGAFRCTSARRGITCTIRAGGRGFRINGDEVVALG